MNVLSKISIMKDAKGALFARRHVVIQPNVFIMKTTGLMPRCGLNKPVLDCTVNPTITWLFLF